MKGGSNRNLAYLAVEIPEACDTLEDYSPTKTPATGVGRLTATKIPDTATKLELSPTRCEMTSSAKRTI